MDIRRLERLKAGLQAGPDHVLDEQIRRQLDEQLLAFDATAFEWKISFYLSEQLETAVTVLTLLLSSHSN